MDMIVVVSIAIATLAFVVLVIYLVMTLCSLRKTTDQTNLLLAEIKNFFGEVDDQAKDIIDNVQVISSSAVNKMQAFDSLFNAISNVGDFFEQKSDFFRRETLAQEEKHRRSRFSFLHEKKSDIDVSEIVDLIGVGIKIWQKYRQEG